MNMSEEKSAFDGLKPQYQLFILKYLIDFNGARAYKAAYPKCKRESTARVQASKLLTKPNIKAALNEKVKEFFNEKEFLIFRQSKELERTSTADIKEYIEYDKNGIINWKKLTDLDTRPISSIELTNTVVKSFAGSKDEPGGKIIEQKMKLKLWDKNRASEVLSKYAGVAENHRLIDKDGNDLFESFLKNLNEE